MNDRDKKYAMICMERYGLNPSDWEDWLELEATECKFRQLCRCWNQHFDFKLININIGKTLEQFKYS